MTLLSNKTIIQHTPIATTVLLEGATVQQLIRMWTERSSEGQSLSAWLCVIAALSLWYNWYRVFTPDQKIARYSTLVGMTLSSLGAFSVFYFRYVVTHG